MAPGREGREREKNVEPGADVDAVAYRVIGAALEVHRVLGPGFLEGVYEEALAVEFGLREIPFERQRHFGVDFKGNQIGEGRVDFLVEGRLVVELKAIESLLPIHLAQALSYLKALDLELALLVNFNTPVLRDGIRRVIRTRPDRLHEIADAPYLP